MEMGQNVLAFFFVSVPFIWNYFGVVQELHLGIFLLFLPKHQLFFPPVISDNQ
jgi:hypothetical protein